MHRRPFPLLLSAIALLAAAAVAAPVEAQRTGSAGRGGAGTATGWVSGATRHSIRPTPPVGRQPADAWWRDDRHRIDSSYRYPDLRYGRSVRRTPYPLPRHYTHGVHYSPLVVYLPPVTTRYVHVQTDVVQPSTTVVVPASAAAPPLESCAVITVLQPDHQGYWKALRFPVAGAQDTDELQRMINARIEEGVPFTLRDPDGETIDIPAGASLDRVIVDRCR